MTIRHMHIFLEVYKEKNMSIAAKNLFMTQPSVSQAIKELEEFYNQKLFERLSRKLYVTDAGELFYEYASQIIRLEQEAAERLKNSKKEKKLCIGGNYTTGIQMMNNYVRMYKEKNEEVEIEVMINKASYIREQLRENKLDMALIEEIACDAKEFVQIPFYKDKIVAVVSPNYNIKKTVMLEEISEQPFLTREKGVGARELFEETMHKKGFLLRPKWESISATALINACKKSEGIGILPYEAVKEELESGKLIELEILDIDLSRNLVICYHKDKYIRDEMQEFINLIRNTNEGDK